jgi:hypothetical protein
MYLALLSFFILQSLCGFSHAANNQNDPPLTAEEAATAYPPLDPNNALGTYLWGFK